jgi:hypothetical protein
MNMGLRETLFAAAVVCEICNASTAAAQTPHELPVGPKTAAACAIADEPYVTTCLVSVAYMEPVALPTLAPQAMPTAVALKRAIEKACGSNIRNVEVILAGGNQATVQLAAPSELQARMFWGIIEEMPGLRPYCLDVRVNIEESTVPQN